MLATAKRKENKRMREKLYTFLTNSSAEGIAVMSLDVLDYSVVHLSAYERSNRKFMRKLRPHDPNFDENNIQDVQKAGEFIRQQGKRDNIDPRAKKVLISPDVLSAAATIYSDRFHILKFVGRCCDAIPWSKHGGRSFCAFQSVKFYLLST